MARDSAEAKRERYRMRSRCDAMDRASVAVELAISDLRTNDQITVLNDKLRRKLDEAREKDRRCG